MQLLRVFPVLGAILMVFALTLLVPLAVSVAMNDGAQAVWLPSLGVTLICGAALRLAVFKVGESEACAAGRFVHVFDDRASNLPVPIPAELRQALEYLVV